MTMRRMEITNTSAQQTLGDAMNIEASEKFGQTELINSEQLPIKCRPGRDNLESAGVVFGEPTKGDPLFCEATLPPGWQKRQTEHSMWSKLIDADGKVRATIFYKAAFYDRRAFMDVAN